MIRFTWRHTETEDPGTPLDWRAVARIAATLFLNLPFWINKGALS
ncbi:MAG TPA: hypothetical protein VHW24_25755 [Bryobacteraceae bacterium]|nr:hypothetical protein [Bryobacteraceae bacterium]